MSDIFTSRTLYHRRRLGNGWVGNGNTSAIATEHFLILIQTLRTTSDFNEQYGWQVLMMRSLPFARATTINLAAATELLATEHHARWP